ncbi:hypothetical protein OK016_10995 [Vibrio chagasii]|nr:hypothetical protein [Vibrio chagasii]
MRKELEDEKIKNLFLNRVVDILDAEHGITSLRKKVSSQGARSLQKREGISLVQYVGFAAPTRQVFINEKSELIIVD